MTIAELLRGMLATGALALMLTSASVAAESAASSYDEAMAEGLYGEAEVFAKQAITRAIAQGVYDQIETATLLIRLAEAQLLQGKHEEARQNFELAVDVVEEKGDRLDRALVGPLNGVAQSYMAGARPDLAVPQIERALHVVHVNDGPHSIEQTASLRLLAAAYEQMGDFDKALDAVERAYFVSRRRHSEHSTEIVPAMMEKGRILGQMGRRGEERDVYEQARQLIEEAGGDPDPLLVHVLLRLGNSYQDEYFETQLAANEEADLPDSGLLSDAQTFFEMAQAVADKLNVEADLRTVLDVQLAMGDFYTLRDDYGPARKHYQEAWRLIATYDGEGALAVSEFDTMRPLVDVSPDLSVALGEDAGEGATPSRYDAGNVVVQFTITRRGRVRDIGLVEMNPARNAAIEEEVVTALKKVVFRPRYENGFAVDWPGRIQRYEYPVPRASKASN